MAEFKLVIISVFVMLTPPFAAGGSTTRLSVSVGGEITLLCQNAEDFHDRCYSTTWIFGRLGSRKAVILFEYGKIHSDARRSHRLSVTANCSLLIKKVTSLDKGHYYCRQFMSGQQLSESMVILSVNRTPASNSTSNVTRVLFPGKGQTNATTTATTTTTTTTTATTAAAKPKSTKPTSTPTSAQIPTTAVIIKSPPETTATKSDMTTTIIKSVTTTTTTITCLMTKTKTTTTTTTKTISPDKITTTKSNTTTITIKSPKKTTTFNSTTTKTTIESARTAEECPNTVESTIMLIIVAGGFVALLIMLAVIIWQISKRNKIQMSGNMERGTNHCLGPETSVERGHSEHNQGNAVTSSNVRLSYTSSGASTDGSSIYATMKRI